MLFDPENKINKLCAQGMEQEGEGNTVQAMELFTRAWNEATTPQEQFIAAHYVARHQTSIAGKLHWDETALKLHWDETALNIALEIGDNEVKQSLPSLYLNVAKGYEDTHNYALAEQYYKQALAHTQYLPDDGYGNLVRMGINNGLQRVAEKHTP